jgi:hypothetical protein
MPYSAYTWFFSLTGTLRTELEYPDWQMASFVPVARIAPGVHAESDSASCAMHPDVLVCTPQCGSPPVVLLPVLPLLPEVGVILGKVMVTDPQLLNAIVKTASSPSKQMIFFIIPLLLCVEIGPYPSG